MAGAMRIEKDSLGEVEVPEDVYYGAQTARALKHFPSKIDQMPKALIHAYGLIKRASAEANQELGLLTEAKALAITSASDEVAGGLLDRHFPLTVWQSGSGTQTNMNVNEVIARRASELLLAPVHPNDDVNLSQSTNDTFPTAMHMAALAELRGLLLPALYDLMNALDEKSREFSTIIKIGRTHLMDAVPLTLGQEFSGYSEQIRCNIERLERGQEALYELAIGATAVGTGLLAPTGFSEKVIGKLSALMDLPFRAARSPFAALAAHDALVNLAGMLVTLAGSLIKIATDLSWMGSGPRCGLSELIFPENEPGSSIMPGKINPTQCEALLMVALQVKGGSLAVSMAGSRGNFELNVYKPLIIFNLSHSMNILTTALNAFTSHFVKGLKANRAQIENFLNRSLMLVTALREKIGYDKASEIALKAYHENLTLKEAAVKLGTVSEEEFDRLVDVKKMVKQ